MGQEDASTLELGRRYLEVVSELERLDEVEQMLEQELARNERDLGAEDLTTLATVEKLADCRKALGIPGEDILPLRKRVVDGRTKFLKKTDKIYYLALTALYECLESLGRGEAESILSKMERWEEDETVRQRKAAEAKKKEEEEAARVAAQKAKMEAEAKEKAEKAAAAKRAAEEKAAKEKAAQDAACDDLAAKALARAQEKKQGS